MRCSVSAYLGVYCKRNGKTKRWRVRVLHNSVGYNSARFGLIYQVPNSVIHADGNILYNGVTVAKLVLVHHSMRSSCVIQPGSLPLWQLIRLEKDIGDGNCGSRGGTVFSPSYGKTHSSLQQPRKHVAGLIGLGLHNKPVNASFLNQNIFKATRINETQPNRYMGWAYSILKIIKKNCSSAVQGSHTAYKSSTNIYGTPSPAPSFNVEVWDIFG